MKKLRPHIYLVGAWRRAVVMTVMALIATCAPWYGAAQINAEQVMAIGSNAMYFDDYLVAIQYFNQAIQAKPYLAKPYFLRSIAKLNLEDYHGAEADASTAIELNEFITDAWEVRGVARQNLGDFRGAVDDYNHALELLPRNRQLLYNMAAAQTELHDFVNADSTYSKLLRYYPNFENGYLGRARLGLLRGDTISAIKDINITLEKDSNSFNGRVMRAELQMKRRRPDYRAALTDMDRAIRLEPRIAGLYINRAYLRYNLHDWYGAMDDYDHALTLEPMNETALFNRGLLNAEVEANDRAMQDFSAVLSMNPADHRALFNRALIRAKKGDYDGAIADATGVIKAFPDFPTGYQLRSELFYRKGDMAHAAADHDRAEALTRRLRPVNGKVDAGNAPGARQDEVPDPTTLTKREFASLLTVDDNTDMREEYNNSAIRGRVQDRNLSINPEGMVELAYYNSPGELNPNTFYIKEIDDLNSTRQLRYVVLATINPPVLTDEAMIKRHFSSIEYYNSYLATHAPRAIDYLGRAMDFMTLRDYNSAIRDLDRAVALMPDYSPAYMMRAQARYRLNNTADYNVPGATDNSPRVDGIARLSLERKAFDDIMSDMDRAIALSPANAFTHYNKAIMLIEAGRPDEALTELNTTIRLKPDFGEAYFNRGYVKLQSGHRTEGVADLSRAGELGVSSAYNLIKRISRH